MQRPFLLFFALVSLVLNGAVFGFFYAWVCSTMWGLDATDPRTAIAAMQAMNASVRNLVFAPAFFATPFVLALTAFLAFRRNIRDAALLFGAASLSYLFGGLLLTASVNVPMNERWPWSRFRVMSRPPAASGWITRPTGRSGTRSAPCFPDWRSASPVWRFTGWAPQTAAPEPARTRAATSELSRKRNNRLFARGRLPQRFWIAGLQCYV